MKIIYAGTPEFAVSALRSVHAAGHEVCAVLTQPDRPAGRGKKLQASPVKQAAQALGLEVWQPITLRNPEIQAELAGLEADIMVVAAYGLMLPAEILNIPNHGCVNIHASLLPRWRGAAPIQRAVEAGDAETGVTFMLMDEGLDTGDMLGEVRCEIPPEMNAGELHDQLAKLGAESLVSVLEAWQAGSITPQPQDDAKSTYAAKLDKKSVRIDWADSAEKIARQIRAFNPWPVSWTELRHGDQLQRVRIYQATADMTADLNKGPGAVLSASREGIAVACGDGLLQIEQLQFPGGKILSAAEASNGRDWAGTRFE